jgi:hypothetical protein
VAQNAKTSSSAYGWNNTVSSQNKLSTLQQLHLAS